MVPGQSIISRAAAISPSLTRISAKNIWIASMQQEEQQPHSDADDLASLLPESPTKKDAQLQELQEDLANERDARREDRFVFIAVPVLLLDVCFFTVMPSFG